MSKKIQFFLAAIPPAIAIVIGIIGYQIDKRSLELQYKKFSEGDIPRKNLRIETYGGTDVIGLLKNIVDAEISINLEGRQLGALYSINYTIRNTGAAPILKEDFSEMLSLEFPDRFQILFFKNMYSYPPDLNPDWEKINDNKITLNPLLINAGDVINLEVYLTDSEKNAYETEKTGSNVEGKWFVRIPNLSKIDFVNRSNQESMFPEEELDNLEFIKIRLEGAKGLETLWEAGYLLLANEWGVYAILALAALMIYVYLNFLHLPTAKSNSSKQFPKIYIAIIAVFSFIASESYITFFALLGRNVYWLNYFFMFFYLISIIVLFLINRKVKVL